MKHQIPGSGALTGGCAAAFFTTQKYQAMEDFLVSDKINYIATFVAALSSFLVGGLWYSPMFFAKQWMEDLQITEEELRGGEAKIFGSAFVLSFIVAWVLGLILPAQLTLVDGAFFGAIVGVGLIAASLSINFLFERRPLRLMIIVGAQNILTFTVMGAILGAWR